MVLPSGDTRVTSLPKSNPLSPCPSRNLSECERLTVCVGQTTASVLDGAGVSNDPCTFKQTDVGSTDPRLVRNIPSRHEDEYPYNEMLNNFTATSIGGCSEVDTRFSEDYKKSSDRCYQSESLTGRFARACLLRDMSPLGSKCETFPNPSEMPNKTSPPKLECSSLYSDEPESWRSSTQSGIMTPNDDSHSGSVTDCVDFLPEISDMSASIEEQTNTSISETDSVSCSPSPIVAKDYTKRDFFMDKPGCGGNSDESMRDVLDVRKTPEDGNGDFDVFNIETTLPYMNWDYLEEQLQKAIEKEQLSQSHRNDREKIRQKLAMGVDDDHFGTTGAGATDRFFKKPSLQVRLHSAMNLQMCFVNEASSEAEAGDDSKMELERTGSASSKQDCRREKSSSQVLQWLSSSSSLASCRNSFPSASVPVTSSCGATQKDLDILTRQARLQAEARLALAQVRPMAHMQLQLEKQTRRKSPIADIVGIPGFGDGKSGKLSRQMLRRMNLGQLQVVVNDMHAQIEAFNVELMELLVERDDLHMAQDSMLVDIEDLTRRAQEYDIRLKSKTAGSQL